MKKIMFKDRYGLTQAVLEGKKTMTRRFVKWNILCCGREDAIYVVAVKVLSDGRRVFTAYNVAGSPVGQVVPACCVGEEVAVAQPYKNIIAAITPTYGSPHAYDRLRREEGWNNKMFVKADLMPHRIRITNIKVERLQDISEEDCMREGVWLDEELTRLSKKNGYGEMWRYSEKCCYASARGAFMELIDRISGKGTWNRNPWVFVYEFELVRWHTLNFYTPTKTI